MDCSLLCYAQGAPVYTHVPLHSNNRNIGRYECLHNIRCIMYDVSHIYSGVQAVSQRNIGRHACLQVQLGIQRVEDSLDGLLCLAQGATAVGTGLNTWRGE